MPTSPLPAHRRDTEPVDAARPHADLSVLGAIERCAITLVTLTVPSTVIDPDAPPVPLPMLDFRLRLTRRSTPRDVTDRAWRHVGEHARAEKGDWNLFALGAAKPRLRKLMAPARN